MRILKLSIGNAVLQQRHMPYIAVSAGLIHTMQFHLPRTVATVWNQGLGYGFNLKIHLFLWKSWISYALIRRRWCILLCACLLVGLYTLITDSQLLLKRLIKIDWLLRLQLGILTVLKNFIVLQTREGGGQGQDHYPLCCCGGGC